MVWLIHIVWSTDRLAQCPYRKNPSVVVQYNKYQGKNTLKLTADYKCYIKANGGFDLKQLREQLLIYQTNIIKGFYDAVVICAGTNDTHGFQLDLSKFLMNHQKQFVQNWRQENLYWSASFLELSVAMNIVFYCA